jgi:hypothetical protein
MAGATSADRSAHRAFCRTASRTSADGSGVDAVLARIERSILREPRPPTSYEELLRQAPHTSEMLTRTLEHVSTGILETMTAGWCSPRLPLPILDGRP